MKKLIFGLLALLVASTSFAGLEVPAPFADPIYVRGGFNDWGLANPMSWDGNNEEYTAVVSIDAGDWEFKIANETWDNPDWGHQGDPLVALGVAAAIGPASFGNFAISIADTGNYLFRIFDFQFLRGPAPIGATIEVTRVVPIPAAGLLMLSALGGLGFLRRRR